MAAVNSDVIFEWLFNNLVGQQVIAIEFGVIESSTSVKLFDVQPVGSGSAYPADP